MVLAPDHVGINPASVDGLLDWSRFDDWKDGFKYYLKRNMQSMIFGFTVYHRDSPQLPTQAVCDDKNPTCCEFSVRIMDMEDPALQYAPFGPDQTLTRCQEVSTCPDTCQYEAAKPTASSDRVCQEYKPGRNR
jgi:hypothetical protein